jgi:hypothetical protein
MLWTLTCLAAGIALATVDVGGRTSWQYLKRAWNDPANTERLASVRATVENAYRIFDPAAAVLESTTPPKTVARWTNWWPSAPNPRGVP